MRIMESSFNKKVSDALIMQELLLNPKTFVPDLLDDDLAVIPKYNEEGGFVANSHKFSDLQVGMWTDTSRKMCDGLVRKFAELTRDANPVHLDDEFAGKTIFKERIVHGKLLEGEISAILGMVLPGVGTIYARVPDIHYMAPTPINSFVETYAFITELEPEKRLLKVRTYTLLPEHEDKIVLSSDNILMLDPSQG